MAAVQLQRDDLFHKASTLSQQVRSCTIANVLWSHHVLACSYRCPQPCHCGDGAQVEGLQAALAAKDRRIEDLRSAEAASDAQCHSLQEQQKVRRPAVAAPLHSTAPRHARTTS